MGDNGVQFIARFADGRGGKPGEEGKREEAVRVHGMLGTREFLLMVPVGWGNYA
jgi:hypothetical protein